MKSETPTAPERAMTIESPMPGERLFLDTGSSGPYGWSSISRFMRCPQLYFWHEIQERRARAQGLDPSFLTREIPLVRGSLVHAGLAHLYARLQAVQGGEVIPMLASPSEAMIESSKRFDRIGPRLLPLAVSIVADYASRYAVGEPRIVSVESLAQTTFLGWPYTARIDLEYQDRAGKVWILDHKCVSRIEGRVHLRYVMSGQMLGLWHLGARRHGEAFGGVVVNLLGVEPRRFERFVPEPAPWMLERFPEIVARAHEGIERERSRIANDARYVVPATPSEHTCWPYNRPCPAFESCRWGVFVDRDTESQMVR